MIDKHNVKKFKIAGNHNRKKAVQKLQASTMMFLPNTKGGLLLNKMRESEDRLTEMTGFKISYTEAAGTKLGNVFSLDLAKNQPCVEESLTNANHAIQMMNPSKNAKLGASPMSQDVLCATQTRRPSQSNPVARMKAPTRRG